MTTEGPPPGDRTLSHLIQAAAGRKCSYCKAEPQEPCTRPGPDKYHVARFKGIGMTQTERRTIEAATRINWGRHTGPKGYLVGELRPYRPEPVPEREEGATRGRCMSMPEPRPYDLGLTANPDLSWKAIGIAVPSPCDLGLTSNPERGWDDTEPEAEPGPEADLEAG
jgi:hypothetical protein